MPDTADWSAVGSLPLAAAADWSAVGSLLLASLAVMGSPGPTTISLVAVGSAFGVRRAVPYMAGIIAGSTAVLLAVATGITALLLAVPALGSVLVVISAAYILWLAYHIATAPPLGRQTAGGDAPSPAGGALLGVANPKAWVAIAAVFASVEVADAAAADAALKIVVLTAMIVLIHVAWLLAGVSIAPLLRHPRRARVVNAALAAGLVAATALAMLPQ
jgi:threonine/homoserine/homoserine lactone efflux protein